jgi:predicted nucleic acid-binding protein
MGIIIDTSVLIATEREDIDFNTWQKYDSAYISSITINELLVGVHRAKSSKIRVKRSAFVEHIINSISNLSFGEEEARVYSQILDDLYKRNITLGSNDMIIGATAITSGYPVLTMNEKDFKRIPGLEVLSIKYI